LEEQSDSAFIFDLLVDFCFCSDIVITFFTAKETLDGHLITDKREIAK